MLCAIFWLLGLAGPGRPGSHVINLSGSISLGQVFFIPTARSSSPAGRPPPGKSKRRLDRNPKVLIVLTGGVAYAYADRGIDMVIADFDHLKAIDPAAIARSIPVSS